MKLGFSHSLSPTPSQHPEAKIIGLLTHRGVQGSSPAPSSSPLKPIAEECVEKLPSHD